MWGESRKVPSCSIREMKWCTGAAWNLQVRERCRQSQQQLWIQSEDLEICQVVSEKSGVPLWDWLRTFLGVRLDNYSNLTMHQTHLKGFLKAGCWAPPQISAYLGEDWESVFQRTPQVSIFQVKPAAPFSGPGAKWKCGTHPVQKLQDRDSKALNQEWGSLWLSML